MVLALPFEKGLRPDDTGVETLPRRRGQAHHALEAVDEVLRRALAVDRRGELDARPDVEDVGLAAVRDAAVGHVRHLARHVGHQFGTRCPGRGRVVQQIAEDGVLDGPAVGLPKSMAGSSVCGSPW